jgi:hypothetical protein
MSSKIHLTRIVAWLLLFGSLVGCATPIDSEGAAGDAASSVGTDAGVASTAQELSTIVRRRLPIRGSFAAPLTGSKLLSFGMMYSMTLRTGALVDRITASFYLPSQPDNLFRPGDQFSSSSFGGTAGGLQPAQTCSGGFAAIGLRGRAGQRLDAFGLICAQILANGEPNLSNLQFHPVQGGSGGTAFSDLCGAGEWLGGLNVWSARKSSGTNDIISAIRGVCYAAN